MIGCRSLQRRTLRVPGLTSQFISTELELVDLGEVDDKVSLAEPRANWAWTTRYVVRSQGARQMNQCTWYNKPHHCVRTRHWCRPRYPQEIQTIQAHKQSPPSTCDTPPAWTYTDLGPRAEQAEYLQAALVVVLPVRPSHVAHVARRLIRDRSRDKKGLTNWMH